MDINRIRKDFPILDQKINGKPLVYLDNAATTQKPLPVIQRISDYYLKENSNVHRGVHHLSQVATEAYENARKYVADFINAGESKEIIFTRGTTESINLLATVFAPWVKAGDEIVVSGMEHHSNLVPWQQLCEKKKARLKVLPVDLNGTLDLNFLEKMLTPRVKLLAITHLSNVLGTINPVKEIVRIAHNKGVPVLLDGAQGIAHTKVDVQDLDADFYAFSGHKMYAPMGIGVLYGRSVWLQKLPPYQFGGEMIAEVSLEKATFNELPYKYEAGTPNVAGALGLEAALRYVNETGWEDILEHEDALFHYASEKLENIDGMRIIGRAKDKAAVISFLVDDIHPFDLGTLLDQMGIAVRTGHHCVQPLMDFYCIPGTVRASFAMYNTLEEIDIFTEAVREAVSMLR
ncbi:Cysteine desulfurase =_ SufS [hydrothermal vent metagenome]|uniref:cysteine desulfurase n=1 Tax=hydrothermal vent metagenome TaxID=652676 RepID=A0A3B0VDV5_9ZZZZ